MKRFSFFMILTLAIAVGIYAGGAKDSTSDAGENSTMMKPVEESETDGTMMAAPPEASEGMEEPAGSMMMAAGGKVAFTTLDDAAMLAKSGPAVLFFYADWCPVCRGDIRQIDSGLHKLGNISVVVVDYDRAADLRKKFGITYQHTYVQIDMTGEKIALWSGGGIDGILSNVVREGT